MNTFIKQLLLSLLLLISINTASAGNNFEMLINNSTVQLGKPVWVTLKSNHLTPSLDTINFSHLESDFEVVKDKNAINTSQNVQSWRIRLYPRKTGTIDIPAIGFHSTQSRPARVNVTQPVDNKTGQPFNVDYQVSQHKPWVRQQVLIHYTFESVVDKLNLEPQLAEIPGSLLLPLTTSTQQARKHFIHTTGWALFNKKPGKQTIKLPPLHLVRDGVVTHTFYPAVIRFNTRPLPSYLPGNIPVGKLMFNVINKPGLVLKDQLAALTLKIEASGIPGQWLPDLKHMFNSNHQLHTYPAQVENTQTSSNNISSRQVLRIPFTSSQQGLIDLPGLSLHYFNPETGKVAKIEIHSPALLSISAWTGSLALIFIIALTSWSVVKTYKWFIPRWECFTAYVNILKIIDNLETAEEIRHTIRQLCVAEKWSENLSLRQWLNKLPVDRSHCDHTIVDPLEKALYRNEVFAITPVREGLRKVCMERYRVLRWQTFL